jgi:hypothetical protein
MRPRILFVALISLATLCQSAIGQVDLKFSGDIRYRQTIYKKSFHQLSNESEYAQMRTRLAADATIDSVARVYIQLQDSRTMGGTDLSGQYVSGTLQSKENVDLHQAYVEISRFLGNHGYLKAGRFEIMAGNERILGVEDWHYVGRAWEGAQIGYGVDQFTASLLRQRLSEGISACSGRETDLWLGTAKFQRNLEGLIAYEHEAGWYVYPVDRLRRFTAAIYGKIDISRLTLESNLALQFGHRPFSRTSGGYFEQTLQAYLVTAELGYRPDTSSEWYAALGMDLSSGDDLSNDQTYEAFVAPYYSAHDFRGDMEYFAYTTGPNEAGILDLYFKLRGSIGVNYSGSTQIHRFASDQEYTSYPTLEKTKNIGWEIDGLFRDDLSSRVYLELGGGLFLPSSEFAQLSEPDNGWWAFGTVGAGF